MNRRMKAIKTIEGAYIDSKEDIANKSFATSDKSSVKEPWYVPQIIEKPQNLSKVKKLSKLKKFNEDKSR